MRRANTIRGAAAHAQRVETTTAMAPAVARRRLQALPGVGPWTSAEVAIVALGDADAVSVGDFHLPHMVSWALAGEPRGSDERMLELLAPFPGHRGRVLRLLTRSGRVPPRRQGLPLRPATQWVLPGRVSPVVIWRPLVRLASISRFSRSTLPAGSSTWPTGVHGSTPRRKQISHL